MPECQYNGRRCFLIPSDDNLGLTQCTDHVEPDGHVYIRCEYFSNRTRIRCSNVRRAKELKFHGFCEKHNGFIERLRREAARARRILDPGCMVDGGLDVNCSSDEFDEVLEKSDAKCPFVFESLYCDARIDNPDNPLRNAGCFTSKEIVQQYVEAVERHKEALLNMRIIYAEKHRRLLAERARQRRNADTENKRPLLDPKNAPSKNRRLRERYCSYARYGSYLRWRRSHFFMERLLKRNALAIAAADGAPPSTSNCQHIERVNLGRPALSTFDIGKSLSENADDSAEVDDVLRRLVDYVDAAKRPFVDVIQTTACDAPRVPLSDFCAEHVLKDEDQFLFSKCLECDSPAMFFSEYHRCRTHFDKLTFNTSRSSSTTASISASLPAQNITIGDDIDAEVYLKMCADMARMEQSQPTKHYGGVVARPAASSEKLMASSGAGDSLSHHGQRPSTVYGPLHHGYHSPAAGGGGDAQHYGQTFRPVRYQPYTVMHLPPEREFTCARVRPYNGRRTMTQGTWNSAPPPVGSSSIFASPRHLSAGGPPINTPRGQPQQSSIVYAAHASSSSQHAVYPSSQIVGEPYHHPERPLLHHTQPSQQSSMHVMPRRIPSQMSVVAQPPSAYPYPIATVQRRQAPPQSPSAEGMVVRSPAVRIMRTLHRGGMPTARRGRGTPRGAFLQSQRHLPSPGPYNPQQRRH